MTDHWRPVRRKEEDAHTKHDDQTWTVWVTCYFHLLSTSPKNFCLEWLRSYFGWFGGTWYPYFRSHPHRPTMTPQAPPYPSTPPTTSWAPRVPPRSRAPRRWIPRDRGSGVSGRWGHRREPPTWERMEKDVEKALATNDGPTIAA